jgi:hypothetical protein
MARRLRSRRGVAHLQHRGDALSGQGLHALEHVPVGGERERGLTLAEPFLDDFHGDTALEEHGRVPVPEVVERPAGRQPEAPAQRDKVIRAEVVVVERFAVRLREDELEGMPGRAVRPHTPGSVQTRFAVMSDLLLSEAKRPGVHR